MCTVGKRLHHELIWKHYEIRFHYKYVREVALFVTELLSLDARATSVRLCWMFSTTNAPIRH